MFVQFKTSFNEEKLNPNEDSTTNLITGIYNVTVISNLIFLYINIKKDSDDKYI